MGRAFPPALQWLLGALLTTSGCWGDRSEALAWWNDLRGDGYALDSVPREVPEGVDPAREALPCPEVGLVRYDGDVVAYARPVRVAAAFQDKLRGLERTAREVATEQYGRAPQRLLHFGVYACRTVSGRDDRLSEHALGNAIDLSGFRFAPAARDQPLPEGVPAQLRRGFVVSVRRHGATEGDGAADLHRRFLHGLVDRLLAEGAFRGVAVYDGHVHLDYAPWRYTRR